MSDLLDEMDDFKKNIKMCVEDVREINNPINDIYDNKEEFQEIIIKGLLNNIRDLTKTINNLNETIRELSRNLDSEIRISEAKNGKIELLHFKYVESRIKVKELRKQLASIKSIVK